MTDSAGSSSAARSRDLRQARRLVISDPEILGGDPVFRDKRVPVHRQTRCARQQASGIDRKLSPAHGRDDPAGSGLCRRLPTTKPAA